MTSYSMLKVKKKVKYLPKYYTMKMYPFLKYLTIKMYSGLEV